MTYVTRVTPEAVHELYRRIEQLEGDLARRNAQAQFPSQRTSVASPTIPRIYAVEQCEALSEDSPTVLVNSSPAGSVGSPRGGHHPNYAKSCQETESFRLFEQHSGVNWYFKGMQILTQRGREWISTRTGQIAVFDKFPFLGSSVDRLTSTTPTIQLWPSQQDVDDLPEIHTTKTAVDILYQSSLRFCLPLLDWDLFQETITKAYRVPLGVNQSHSQIPAKACVWAVHAIVNRSEWLRDPNSGDGEMYGERCVSKAQALLGLVAEEPSLDLLQALLLLVRLGYPGL